MTDERTTFESTRARLEEILAAVRKKDTSLEQSLELLEEGVRLANLCNELIDQSSWRSLAAEGGQDGEDAEDAVADGAVADAAAAEGGAVEGVGVPEAAGAAAIPDDERS
ncbi:MAG TPA: exodeoxyribonuclease VII small subunit [Coriobacteriia bacterium]